MDYSICLYQSDAIKIFVDREPDTQDANIYTFCENRVVPVYYYFPKYKIAHLIKTLPGKCILPFINQPVESLLCVQSRFLNRLLEFTNTCRKNRVNLDDMPHQFFVEFSLALTGRGFNKDKGRRIYKKHRGW